MTTITVGRDIYAPVDTVFSTVADIRNFRKAIPDIVEVEFLSDVRSGVGTRFRETRVMKSREASTDLEIKEYHENKYVRLVSDSHGTVWDSVFSVREQNGGTRLELVMEARPYKVAAKVSVPLMLGMVRKALEEDMDAVKRYCEGNNPGG